MIVRLAERDPRAATLALIAAAVPIDEREEELADRLARAGDVAIGRWACAEGRARETVSRQFRLLYGVDSAAYLAEARARRAWRMVVTGAMPLADIAHESGYADQAHMTRAVRALTGHTPGQWWRASHPFKTG